MNSRRVKDGITRILIYLSAATTIAILGVIIAFILAKGLPGINIDFLTNDWESKTTFVNVIKNETEQRSNDKNYIPSLGISILKDQDNNIYVKKVYSDSPVKDARNMKNERYQIKSDDIIKKVDDVSFENMELEEAVQILNTSMNHVRLKVERPGGGIIPMFVSTIYIILLSLLIAAPIGILSAVYLNEYARPGKVLKVIRFAIQALAGIPSIIYGLFGMLVFVQIFKMQYSILAGSLTLSIILLPTLTSTTEESLKAIPKTYRESSLGLGATKLQTLYKIILPNALPGILVAIILSIGRIVGESAALILTAGTVAQIPSALTGNSASAATLTIKLYTLMKEEGNLAAACSIAVILLALIIVLNLISKIITRYFLAKQGN